MNYYGSCYYVWPLLNQIFSNIKSVTTWNDTDANSNMSALQDCSNQAKPERINCLEAYICLGRNHCRDPSGYSDQIPATLTQAKSLYKKRAAFSDSDFFG